MVRLRVIIGSTGLYICMGIDNWIKGKIGCVLDGVFVCEWIVSLLVNSCKWCIYVNMYKSSVCLLFLNVLVLDRDGSSVDVLIIHGNTQTTVLLLLYQRTFFPRGLLHELLHPCVSKLCTNEP